jgi:hypothetical protein
MISLTWPKSQAHGLNMNTTLEKAFSVGKYLVSPLSRLSESGRYLASVSIRSGSGRGTHDRVFRFVPQFDTQEGALQYAIDEGHNWLRQRHTPA